MCDKQKAMGLLTQITRGLLKHGRKETEKQLGDRSHYIGMSDIGCGVECLRKAVAGKVYGNLLPEPDDVLQLYRDQDYEYIQQVLSKQLILQRGHWLESGILDALYANTGNLFSQLEIEVENHGVPVKAHLDFVLVAGGKTPVVRILELKSTEHIPKHLYSAYEMQLYSQLGMLTQFWSKPVFNLKSEQGEILFSKLTFPDMVQKAFGIELPDDVNKVDLEGWVLALSMKGAKAFGPYLPSELMFDVCRNTAEEIWKLSELVKTDKITLNDIEYCHGFHPLCDYCDHKDGCPKFQAIELDEPVYNELLREMDKLKLNKKKLEEEISETERIVQEFYNQCNVNGQWLDVGDYKFRCTEVEGRTTLDRKELEQELIQQLGESETQELLARCSKQGSPYQRLYITKNNNGVVGI